MNDSHAFEKNSLTRRRILGWGGVGALAGVAGYIGWPKPKDAVAPSGAVSQRSNASNPGTSDELLPVPLVGRDAFLPHLKSNFQIQISADSASTVCKLVRVSDEVVTVAPTARFASYSLLFSAPKEFVAESRIYHLIHPQMGAMDLFLSPVGKSDEVVHLEAVCSMKV